MIQKLFYLHIPKTGGRSFINHLEDLGSASDVIVVDNNESFLGKFHIENSAPIIVGHQFYPFIDVIGKSTRVVTFLREPVSRVISAYEYIKNKKSHVLHNLLVKKHISSISEFVNDPEFAFHTENMQTRMLGASYDLGDIYIRYCNKEISIQEASSLIQMHESKSCNSDMLHMATTRLSNIFFVGITEHLNQSIECFFKSINRAPPSIIYHNNKKSDYANAQPSYSDEDISNVMEKNLYDIELYRHALSEFNKRTECPENRKYDNV